jgi:hypothetical protein
MGVSDEAKNVIPLKFLRKIKNKIFFPPTVYQNMGKEKQKSTCFGIFCKNRLFQSYEFYSS